MSVAEQALLRPRALAGSPNLCDRSTYKPQPQCFGVARFLEPMRPPRCSSQPISVRQHGHHGQHCPAGPNKRHSVGTHSGPLAMFCHGGGSVKFPCPELSSSPFHIALPRSALKMPDVYSISPALLSTPINSVARRSPPHGSVAASPGSSSELLVPTPYSVGCPLFVAPTHTPPLPHQAICPQSLDRGTTHDGP